MAPLRTARLTLRPWRETDRPAFAALNADPEVARDLGGPLARADSDAKLDRYLRTWKAHGHGRWAVEDTDGRFVGYAGVQPSPAGHPIGPHAEVGWRLARLAWGKGYATEATRAALDDFFARAAVAEVLAYTSADNARSQAVMARLGLRRDPTRDFDAMYDGMPWHGLVWVAEMRQAVTQV
jgi:RimJ/RimL family protein N-acetyltransferase